jgi:hypothetical protein
MIGQIANVLTYGHAAHGEGVIVLETIKVYEVSQPTAMNSFLVLEIVKAGTPRKIIETRVVETLIGYIHQDV